MHTKHTREDLVRGKREGIYLVRGEGKREDLVRGKVAKIRLSRAFS